MNTVWNERRFEKWNETNIDSFEAIGLCPFSYAVQWVYYLKKTSVLTFLQEYCNTSSTNHLGFPSLYIGVYLLTGYMDISVQVSDGTIFVWQNFRLHNK